MIVPQSDRIRRNAIHKRGNVLANQMYYLDAHVTGVNEVTSIFQSAKLANVWIVQSTAMRLEHAPIAQLEELAFIVKGIKRSTQQLLCNWIE